MEFYLTAYMSSIKSEPNVVEAVYSFLVSASSDERGVEAEKIIAYCGGYVGQHLLKTYCPELFAIPRTLHFADMVPGTSIFLPEISEATKGILEAIYSSAAKAGIGIEPPEDWIGKPIAADRIMPRVLEFNRDFTTRLDQMLSSYGFAESARPLVLIHLGCIFIQQTANVVVPREAKQLLVWSALYAAKTVPLSPR